MNKKLFKLKNCQALFALPVFFGLFFWLNPALAEPQACKCDINIVGSQSGNACGSISETVFITDENAVTAGDVFGMIKSKYAASRPMCSFFSQTGQVDSGSIVNDPLPCNYYKSVDYIPVPKNSTDAGGYGYSLQCFPNGTTPPSSPLPTGVAPPAPQPADPTPTPAPTPIPEPTPTPTPSAGPPPAIEENTNGGLSDKNCIYCFESATKGCSVTEAEQLSWNTFGEKCEKGTFSDIQKQSIKNCASIDRTTINVGQCKTVKSLFQDLLISGSDPTTEVGKCVKDLNNCTQLFLACQGNTGGIKTNDLEGQCNYFLQGGKKWADFKGADFCTQAMSKDGPIKTKCDTYKADIGKAKASLDIVQEQKNIAQKKAEAEANTKDVFNKINTTDAKELTARIISTAIGILGSIALVMFIYGGVLWMIAEGESAQVEKAQSVVVWSSLGLAVIFASYAILKMVFDAFK